MNSFAPRVFIKLLAHAKNVFMTFPNSSVLSMRQEPKFYHQICYNAGNIRHDQMKSYQ